MANPWFRMYGDLLDDPKVQRLDPVLFKTWVNLLCLASRNDGKLPYIGDVAFALRVDEETATVRIDDLVGKGLIDVDDCELLSPHNWDRRQYKSDRDDTAAERQRRKRDKDKPQAVTDENVTRDITDVSRPPDTEQNRTEDIRLDDAGASVARETKSADQFDVIERQMREAAGWQNEPHPNLAVIGPAISAMNEGVDLDLDLLPACRVHGPKIARRTSWNYILQAAISNRDNRISMASDASKPIQFNPAGNRNERTHKPSVIERYLARD